MDDASRSPGIKVPPPVFAVLAALGGWLLQAAWPLPAPAGFWRSVPACLLLAAGFAVALWGAATLRRHRTTVRPDRAATALVEDGPYAFSRNPLYLALCILTLGFGFLLRAPWIFILWPLLALALDRFAIAKEEAHLAARFGGAYEAYKRRVRRWI